MPASILTDREMFSFSPFRKEYLSVDKNSTCQDAFRLRYLNLIRAYKLLISAQKHLNVAEEFCPGPRYGTRARLTLDTAGSTLFPGIV